MKKKKYRFGMAYLGQRHVWITKNGPVIRDTHCEWKVSDLWNLYMAPKEVADEQAS